MNNPPDQLRLQIDSDHDLAPAWPRVLSRSEERFGRQAVEAWLRQARPLSLRDGVLVVGAANSTAREWIRKKYAPVLTELFAEEHGEPVRIDVVIAPAEAPPAERPRVRAAALSGAPPTMDRMFRPLPLHEHFTFANFVVGQSNRLAHAAAMRVAEEPGGVFNPLFIYGGSGLGKTHLLHAIGHRRRERNPRARIAYVSAEAFTSHFILSLRDSKEEAFRRHYRSVDIWLVDDIQFIADKTSTKEEFFHTFNELYLTNRQIVCAADRPPRELRLMEDRLRSRLQSGMLGEILPPELETRMAILEQRAILEQVEIPADVILCLASAIKDNVRELEAALIRLLALASLNQSEVTAELATQALEAFVSEGGVSDISIADIQETVCEQFGVATDALLGPRRDRKTSLARQVAMYLCRRLSRNTLTVIGDSFGGKTHSTVLYACNKLEKEMKQDEALAEAVQRLCRRLAAASGARTGR